MPRRYQSATVASPLAALAQRHDLPVALMGWEAVVAAPPFVHRCTLRAFPQHGKAADASLAAFAGIHPYPRHRAGIRWHLEQSGAIRPVSEACSRGEIGCHIAAFSACHGGYTAASAMAAGVGGTQFDPPTRRSGEAHEALNEGASDGRFEVVPPCCDLAVGDVEDTHDRHR